MLTWSLGCALSPGERRRSPRWRSCSMRCPSRSGTRRSETGRRTRRRRLGPRPRRSVRRSPVEQTQLGVHAGGGALDPPQPVDHRDGNGLTGDREVGHRLRRLCRPRAAPFPGHPCRSFHKFQLLCQCTASGRSRKRVRTQTRRWRMPGADPEASCQQRCTLSLRGRCQAPPEASRIRTHLRERPLIAGAQPSSPGHASEMPVRI